MVIRPATANDLPAIAEIQASTVDAAHWDPASYLSYDCLVADSGGSVVGFLVTRQTSPGEHEILNLAILPNARRQGIGTSLLHQVLTQDSTWFLEVRESNLAAQELYRSLGFEQAGRRLLYYRDPDEAGIVMKRGS